jgi:hypothetical protein
MKKKVFLPIPDLLRAGRKCVIGVHSARVMTDTEPYIPCPQPPVWYSFQTGNTFCEQHKQHLEKLIQESEAL